ncbi:MAG TPA: hypothetical protein VKI62_00015, partial [Bacteroidota bacterium]|nr:hypothetical protein [Bacteroidota bacterium]
MATTRSMPEFPYDSQKELYISRKSFASLTGFPFDAEYEEVAISSMTIDQANTALALINEMREKYDSQKKGKKKKKTETGDEEKRDSSDKGDEKGPSNEGDKPSDPDPDPDKPADTKTDDEDTKPKDTPPDDSGDSSESSSDDGDDPRKRTSRKDKETVRGRTPRVETGRRSNKQLFKMDSSVKYTDNMDSDRTYA